MRVGIEGGQRGSMVVQLLPRPGFGRWHAFRCEASKFVRSRLIPARLSRILVLVSRD